MTDTRAKRASAVNISCPWRSILPAPDGAVGDDDRQTVPFMYSGILAGEAPEGGGSGVGEFIYRRRHDNL